MKILITHMYLLEDSLQLEGHLDARYGLWGYSCDEMQEHWRDMIEL